MVTRTHRGTRTAGRRGALPGAPPPPLSGDVGPALFVGVNRFFDGQPEPVQLAPHRGQRRGRPQRVAQFRKRRIRPGSNERGQLRFMPRQYPPAKFRLLQPFDRPGCARPMLQRIDPGPTHVIPLGEILRRQASVRILNHAFAQSIE